MNYNETYFNCNIDDSCRQKIGYTKHEVERILFIIFSSLGILSNFIFIIFNLKKNKTKTKKASMRKIFLIFPFTDLLTAIYWLISALIFYDLEHIQNNILGCSLASCLFMHVSIFQLTFINALLFHFRKINTNPIEGILKPNKRIIIYSITCFIIGAIVTGLSEEFRLLGRSPLNTCFINTKYGGYFGYIYLIPIISIICAIIQLIHDLFFKTMFNSDKGIRRIHRKNSCFVLIFCLFHIPLIVAMIISFLLKENNFGKNQYRIFFIIITYLLCLTPLLMSIIRQIQGLTRFECINEYVKKKKKNKIVANRKSISPYRRMTATTKDDPSLASDVFEWLENHVMEYFMRDILLGVAASLKKSKYYDKNSENMHLNIQDFKKYARHEINFDNYKDYDLNDNTVEKSEYLNVRVIDYAPKCFYYLRNLENIDIDNMIESFLPKNNKQGIRKSQGKSGSFFISTDDNKYMVKTLKSDELELLKHAFLKEYVHHIKKNPKSLLCRLYGMYNIILGQGDEILIIVMRNVIGDFKDNTIVKFDLKGSTYKRKANFDMANNNNVMKDLDFNEFEKSIMLSLSSIQKLRDITAKDSKFLCKSDLMDYSLFLVKLTLSKKEAIDVFGDNITEKQDNDYKQIISEEDNCNIDYIRKSNTYRGEGIIHDVEHYRQYLFPSLTQGTAYIISIIDYFQFFNFFKYVESGLKTNFFSQKKKKIISCVDPQTYSNRFINYIISLTDVKQFLSNEIQEAPQEIEDLSDDDDSEEENSIFKKLRHKISSSFENKSNENTEILLPIDVNPEAIQTYSGPRVNLKPE